MKINHKIKIKIYNNNSMLKITNFSYNLFIFFKNQEYFF